MQQGEKCTSFKAVSYSSVCRGTVTWVKCFLAHSSKKAENTATFWILWGYGDMGFCGQQMLYRMHAGDWGSDGFVYALLLIQV